jgi:hypothetical protein
LCDGCRLSSIWFRARRPVFRRSFIPRNSCSADNRGVRRGWKCSATSITAPMNSSNCSARSTHIVRYSRSHMRPYRASDPLRVRDCGRRTAPPAARGDVGRRPANSRRHGIVGQRGRASHRRLLKVGKCKIEAAALSPVKQHLATCAKASSYFGMRVRQVGAVYAVRERRIVGRIASGKRGRQGWVERTS